MPTSEINAILGRLTMLCAGVTVSLTVLMVMVGGILKTVGQTEEGNRRIKSAISGMVMVIGAPAVVGVVAAIVRAIVRLTGY